VIPPEVSVVVMLLPSTIPVIVRASRKYLTADRLPGEKAGAEDLFPRITFLTVGVAG